jgi:phosphatidate cytidylyltransferase
MLSWRITLGALLILTMIALCWLDVWAEQPQLMPRSFANTSAQLPGLFLVPVVVLVAVLATQETLRLAAAGGVQPAGMPVYLGNVLIVLGQWAPVFYGFIPHAVADPRGLVAGRGSNYMELFLSASRSPLWALGLGVIIIFLHEMSTYRQPGGSLLRIAVSVFALVYVGVMLAFAVQLRLFWGIGAVASWIVTVKMGDIGAYTIGRLFGQTKMAPAISPGKTNEGAIGAVLFACLGSWISFHGIGFQWIHWLGNFQWLSTIPSLPFFHQLTSIHWDGIVPNVPTAVILPPGLPIGWLFFGLFLGMAGLLADLAESLLKRDVGMKDSSDWMPGFGGVLDILDSLLLSAPVAWLLWAAGVVGPGGMAM